MAGGAQSVRGLEEASFFDAYRTYDEFNTFIDQLVSTYPQLATKLVRRYKKKVEEKEEEEEERALMSKRAENRPDR